MLFLKESFMLTVYFLIAFVSLVFGSIITNKKVRKAAVCGVIISVIGVVYMFMPFHVTDLKRTEVDLQFHDQKLVANYKEQALSDEQVDKILSYVPELKLKSGFGKEFRMFGNAENAYRAEFRVDTNWVYIQMDYDNPENSFLKHPEHGGWFLIDYESAEGLLAYLQEVIED